MTDAPFPFDPVRLAALAKFAAETRAAAAPPPFAGPVVIDDKGYAWIPHPDPERIEAEGETLGCFVHTGVRVGWASIAGVALIAIFGGQHAEDGFDEEGLAAVLTPLGLRGLARDLESIADAVEALA